MFNVNLIY